jgi:glycosyltransferase involved in cell wall biosynthesis
MRFWKRWPGGIYLYYLLWQIGAYRLAKKLHAREHFDCVQHITFVSFRQPSFMGFLGIPFIFGPVGGGETTPRSLLKGIPFSGRIAEAVRNIGNALVSVDPLMALTFSRAHTIACATEETQARIPLRFREKCLVQRAIGINESEIVSSGERTPSRPQFLYVGRLLYWKGLHLVFRALRQIKEPLPNVTLRIIGQGSDHDWLVHVTQDEQVSELIQWIPMKPHDEIWEEYRESVALVFPSLHDSGGMVVIEALAAGLPVISLDLGGPGSIVTSHCGVVIGTIDASEESVVERLARSMILLATDSDLRNCLSTNAIYRARELVWDAAAEALYSPFVTSNKR